MITQSPSTGGPEGAEPFAAGLSGRLHATSSEGNTTERPTVRRILSSPVGALCHCLFPARDVAAVDLFGATVCLFNAQGAERIQSARHPGDFADAVVNLDLPAIGET